MSATGPDLPQQIEDEGANRRVRIFSGRHRPPHLCYCAPGPVSTLTQNIPIFTFI
jgi:hypothetical protein